MGKSELIPDFEQAQKTIVNNWECPVCKHKSDVQGVEYEPWKFACECTQCGAMQANPAYLPIWQVKVSMKQKDGSFKYYIAVADALCDAKSIMNAKLKTLNTVKRYSSYSTERLI